MLLFFPQGKISQVTPEKAQEALIESFKQWGMPKSIRIDNGKPLAEPHRKSISEIALWLEGLGITVIFNRPRRPTDNAKVERIQQTSANWIEIDKIVDIKHLKKALSIVSNRHLNTYKVRRLENRTRADVFPNIHKNDRKYKAVVFNPTLAYQRLEKWIFSRKTSSIGQFSIYGQVYYLGKNYPKQIVTLKFDSENIQWIVKDDKGNFIKNIPAKNFTKENLLNLSICQRTNTSKSKK